MLAALLAWRWSQSPGSKALRARYGLEYDRALREHGGDRRRLQSSAVVADRGFSFAIGQLVRTPLHVVVDPRTMKIVHRVEGWNGQYTELFALAQKNADRQP